jgi:hypothetical protein
MPKKPFQFVDNTWPLYRRYIPPPMELGKFTSRVAIIDLTHSALPPFGERYNVAEAVAAFDRRAAAAVSSEAGFEDGINLGPSVNPDSDLLEQHYGGDDQILVPTSKCLSLLAFYDFFPKMIERDDKRLLVSKAILRAKPGWCGVFGPGSNGTINVIFHRFEEGNYDMSQMHLLQIAYRHYEQLTPQALNQLITVLLATGRIHRPNIDDRVTSGGPPNDWARAAFLDLPLKELGALSGIPAFAAAGGLLGRVLGVHPKVKRIGETENHIFTIRTAQYLTNQLLYQRDPTRDHDNRSNGFDGAPSSMELMLSLLHDILRDDFSEYNAKNYQNETRYALLNLCSYAYDHEVRLGARMALDYISAHIAVSSNDLRRMVPFRRRNEGVHSKRSSGFMEVGLIETTEGADPMTPHFAILAGNTRTYSTGAPNRPQNCINSSGYNGHEGVPDALSDYRLPPSIHDLFMNDMHRRFFQRISRVPLDDEDVTGRNCSNYEIYASSPSYLISAGGSPATYAIDPSFLGVVVTNEDQQLGVAVTTSFMPTGTSAGRPNTAALFSPDTLQNSATEVIQFSSFSDRPGKVSNYGVAPDFACGHVVYLPEWCKKPINGTNAGNEKDKFLNGTVLNSERDSGIVRIRNPHLHTEIVLNMSDKHHPKRTAEDGTVEEAGSNQEVWVNFKWQGEQRGDFFHPFNTIAGAVAAVADGGAIRIMPGQTTERPTFSKAKRYKLVAPAGGVAIGI